MSIPFKDETSRNLYRIFPPDGPLGFGLPHQLSEGVQLVHDYLSTLPNSAVSIFDNNGAADTISITQGVGVPEGFCWICEELGLFTDDGTSRRFTVFLHYINSAGDFAIPIFNQDSGATANAWWATGKRFIMPPASKLELQVPALTAGKKIRYTMAYLQVPLGQFSPRT